MDKRLNYRKLMQQWMQFYSLPVEVSRRMYAAIRKRLQALTGEPDEEGEGKHESHME